MSQKEEKRKHAWHFIGNKKRKRQDPKKSYKISLLSCLLISDYLFLSSYSLNIYL